MKHMMATENAGSALTSGRFRRGGGAPDLPATLAVAGNLEARLATNRTDVSRAQRLRYQVFFEEGCAIPGAAARLARRDLCRFDRVCDHLIVVDHALDRRKGAPHVVGVYRLLRQEVAEANFGFYSASEFDVGALAELRPHARLLELGRACVASSHRGKRVLELLWRAVWLYARRYEIDALVGCVSLPGTDAEAHAAAIAFLSGTGGDPAWRIAARPELAAARPRAPEGCADPRSLSRTLPALVKGYWRLGATFSPDAVVDRAFGTTDLFVALPLADVGERYLDHFRVEGVAAQLAA